MSDHINLSVDNLVKKIRHLLISNLGKVEEEASIQEFYIAFCIALREEIMVNWIATKRTFYEKKVKMLYYLSMEYLPGKLLPNNITNLKAHDLVREVLKKCSRKFSELEEYDPDLGLGNGGLGRLASCFLDSLATQKYPAMAYGLRYHYGIFEQEIWDGMQIERPDCWLLTQYPWEWRSDASAVSIYYRGKMIPGVNSHGDEVFQLEDQEEVRAIPYDIPIVGYSEDFNYSVLSLRLWSTKESPKNFELQRYNAGELGQAGENTSLTDVLYPNDYTDTGKRIRLKQEFLLVSASVQDILKRHLEIYEDVLNLADKVEIQINDTHPALVVIELMRRLVKNHDIPWKKALEITHGCCNFTNHTVLKESLEEWGEQRMQDLLPRQHRMIQKINQQLCDLIRKKYPNDDEKIKRMSIIENSQIKMANLAIYGCKKINGVAKLHTEILKHHIFPDFYEMFPDKFIAITNGISPRKWLLNANFKLADLITEKIGKDWLTDLRKIDKFHDYASDKDTQEKFLEIKKRDKEKLIDFLSKENPIRNIKGKIETHSPVLDPSALFDIQIKRFHEYKRQLLNALHLMHLYIKLNENPESIKIKRMVVIGGKAAPGYEVAKQIIQLFFCIARKIGENPKVSEKLKIAFVENYNVSKAEIIIPAADLSEQISTAGLEASGTGNMKLTLNGALTIGTKDGANIEMEEAVSEKWWPFAFGSTAEEIKKAKQENSYKSWEVYMQDDNLKKVIDLLKSSDFAKSEQEKKAVDNIYEVLLDGFHKVGSDPYFVLNDFNSYRETQEKVEKLFLDPLKWAEYAIHNIASMGQFSSDVVIEHYIKEIWHLEKCPIDKTIYDQVQKEYSEKRPSY